MDLLADFGDGNFLRLVFGLALGMFAGWYIPQPKFITNLFNKAK